MKRTVNASAIKAWWLSDGMRSVLTAAGCISMKWSFAVRHAMGRVVRIARRRQRAMSFA